MRTAGTPATVLCGATSLSTTLPAPILAHSPISTRPNILAPALIELSDELKRLTKPDGLLVISGVLTEHYEHVAQALAPLQECDRIEYGGWAAVAFRAR